MLCPLPLALALAGSQQLPRPLLDQGTAKWRLRPPAPGPGLSMPSKLPPSPVRPRYSQVEVAPAPAPGPGLSMPSPTTTTPVIPRCSQVYVAPHAPGHSPSGHSTLTPSPVSPRYSQVEVAPTPAPGPGLSMPSPTTTTSVIPRFSQVYVAPPCPWPQHAVTNYPDPVIPRCSQVDVAPPALAPTPGPGPGPRVWSTTTPPLSVLIIKVNYQFVEILKENCLSKL
jgi:hypothetical protein